MKLYYDAAYGLLFICAGLGIGYFDAYIKNTISELKSHLLQLFKSKSPASTRS